MGAVETARDLHERALWSEACTAFRDADAASALDVDDLERWAEAAQLTGAFDDTIGCLERAFARRAEAEDLAAAATDAYWIYTTYLYAREFVLSSGWLTRLEALAQTLSSDRPGWWRVAHARLCITQGRFDDALALLPPAIAEGDESGEVDLSVMARTLTARALLLSGRVDDGIPILDGVMLQVTAAQTSPRMTSGIYCSAIGTCEAEAFDLIRAQDWARHLERWMAELPTPVSGALLGHCQVYRAALKRRRGELSAARDDLERAVVILRDQHGVLVEGHAWYELAEVRRLLGDDAGAEGAFRAAMALGYPVHPGLALLRLAQGSAGTAVSGLRRALAETVRPQERAHLLPAMVSSSIAAAASHEAAAHDLLAEAHGAAAELERLAEHLSSTALDCAAARARGELALAAGDAQTALRDLRAAAELCRTLGHPCDTAGVQVMIAAACRQLGDDEGSRMELESAAEAFGRTGARRELASVNRQLSTDSGSPPSAHVHTPEAFGLTTRELEVLELVADGRTNKSIADELYVSERTVHRHVSSIFDKLGVRSRTEAAMAALAKHLVERGPDV